MKTIVTFPICFLLGLAVLFPQTIQFAPYEFKNDKGAIVEAEMGSLQVPENRNNPSTRMITLKMVRFKSTNPNPSAPIIYLAGGPGGSGISTARGKRFDLFMELRDIADVIALDQRGTGLSSDIPRCSTDSKMSLEEPGTFESYLEVMHESSEQCLGFWIGEGIDINGYNTIENAKDIDALRQALGVERINLWGISYGSHLGFAYSKLFEDRVEKMVMASLEGPNETIKLPKNNESYLERLNLALKKDTLAYSKYGNLQELMRAALDSLRRKPVQTTFFDGRSNKEIKVGISDFDLKLVTSYFLTKNPEDASALPLIYHEVLNGKFDRLVQMVAGMKKYANRVRLMPLVADVASGVSVARHELITKQSKTSILSGTTNFPYPDIGEGLGIEDLGTEYRKPFKSKARALFFSGTLDGRTYLESATNIVADFKNATHITVDGAGHDLYTSSPEIIELMKSFLSGEMVKSKTIKVKIQAFR
ncbi:alpha/beta fold hydrolase [uncultured Croceitalea sp.]|uniref:alpha/beta hydrolase n=1 Tax=uncultured Croceitalea sp. TaxID=1798908 RepID=UPI0033066569